MFTNGTMDPLDFCVLFFVVAVNVSKDKFFNDMSCLKTKIKY